MHRRYKQFRWCIRLTRREFFKGPLAWLKSGPTNSRESKKNTQHIPLSSLRDIPDAVLIRIVPVLRNGWSAHVCENGVAYQDASGEEGVVFLGKEALSAVLLFDGISPLKKVALALEKEFEITSAHSTAIVRETFLVLAMREIYHPSGSIKSLYKN